MPIRRFRLTQKAPPQRLLAEGVLFGNGKVALMDYGVETVLPYRSIEQMARERVVAFEIDWIDVGDDS